MGLCGSIRQPAPAAGTNRPAAAVDAHVFRDRRQPSSASRTAQNGTERDVRHIGQTSSLGARIYVRNHCHASTHGDTR
jgi:hypothetical protein